MLFYPHCKEIEFSLQLASPEVDGFQFRQFLFRLENLTVENEESRLGMLQNLRKLNRAVEAAELERETILKREAPKVSAEIEKIEAMLRSAPDIKSLEKDSENLASLLTEEGELKTKLRLVSYR